MKAYVDGDLCIGCGVCPTVCPEVFEIGLGNDVATVVIGDAITAGRRGKRGRSGRGAMPDGSDKGLNSAP